MRWMCLLSRDQFLGVFANLWEMIVSIAMSICPASWNNLPPTGQIFMKFDIQVFFWKSVKLLQVPLKSDKNNGHITLRPVYIFYHISFNSS